MQQKGFTIIELIVVIAIIAVLAAIVLVNVTQYIGKGRSSAIEGNMSTLLTNGAAYFDANGSNTGSQFCADTSTGAAGPINTAIVNAKGTGFSCFGSAVAGNQSWCTKVVTPTPWDGTNTNYCVDSTGYKGATNNCAAAHFTCL